VIDNAMKSLGGTVLRRSLDDVQAEIAAAEDAQRTAAHEARKRLREQRQAKTKEEIRAKLDELKAKLKRLRVGAGGG
jgi:multidrug resistance efflux pump